MRWPTRIERCPRSCDRLRRLLYLFQHVREGPTRCLLDFRDPQRIHAMRLLVGSKESPLDSVRGLSGGREESGKSFRKLLAHKTSIRSGARRNNGTTVPSTGYEVLHAYRKRWLRKGRAQTTCRYAKTEGYTERLAWVEYDRLDTA